MRRLIIVFMFLTALLLSVPEVFATHYSPERIRRWADNTPRKEEENLTALAVHLTRPLDDDYDKAMAIAYWIAGHIVYDDYIYNGQPTKLAKNYDGQRPQELLKSRVGICGDYAELFVEMCERVGIRAYTVHGYAYPARKHITQKQRAASGHAWNYFIYRSKKIYVDTTFMSKASTGINGRISNLSHRRTLKTIKRENKHTSQTHDFDTYYFDFSYKDEARDRQYTHEER